jgi:CRP/FNR family transcriptional regulator
LSLLDGLVRLFIVGPEGQQSTVQYLRSGDALGLFNFRRIRLPVNVQALANTTALELQPGEIELLAQQNREFSEELAAELLERWQQTLAMLGLQSFGSMRERVAHHLLAVASWDRASRRFSTNLSQQQLADSVGTVRDVVGRVLRELRDRGAVDLRRGAIDILDIGVLQAELRTRFPQFVSQLDGQVVTGPGRRRH